MTSIRRTLLEIHQGAQQSSLHDRIRQLTPAMAKAAQAVYDAWNQDEDGMDEEFGGGGACDEIASEIASILAHAGIDTTEGGQDGDDHAYLYAYDDREAFEVDIPPHVYERGSGYSWTKIPGVVFEADDVQITPVKRADILAESLLTEAFDPSSIPWYRGTDVPGVFGNTDTDGQSQAYHQRGPGWYLTSNREDASYYGKLNQFRLNPGARVLSDKTRFSARITSALVMAAPDVGETMWDWDADGEGNVKRGLKAFIDVVFRQGMAEAVQSVSADFYKSSPDAFVANMAKFYDAYVTDPLQSGVRHMILYNKQAVTPVG